MKKLLPAINKYQSIYKNRNREIFSKNPIAFSKNIFRSLLIVFFVFAGFLGWGQNISSVSVTGPAIICEGTTTLSVSISAINGVGAANHFSASTTIQINGANLTGVSGYSIVDGANVTLSGSVSLTLSSGTPALNLSSTNPVGASATTATVLANTSGTNTQNVCDSYTWTGPLGDGATYTTSGTHIHVSTNAAGCQHTETLNLTIRQSTSNTTFQTSCDSFTWTGPLGNGNTYTNSGIFTSPTINAAGCQHIETLNLTINQSPTATAGGSQTICENASATVSGASSTNGTILWTHNGGGSLNDATTLTPTYTASASDGGNTVTLTMTVSNAPCSPAQATYTINVIKLPVASAGTDQTICVDTPVTLSGAITANGTIQWSTNGLGTLTNATALTPTYAPAPGDSETDVTLTLTVTSPIITNPLCGPTVSTKILRIKGVPTATAGGSQTICENASAKISGASSTNGTILWKHNGSGSLSGDNTLTPTYTASAADGGNTVTLTMTVSNPPCGPAQANYTINVIKLPVASAGADQTICVDTPVTLSGASSANGTIQWTTNGLGTLTNATTLTPTYTPVPGDSETDVTLTLTVTSPTITNPLCGPAISTKILRIKGVPTATAGGSQTICENASATVNGASSTNGTILWTHNGGGSLSDATTLTPTYTASASDGGNTVTLTMTVSNAPCGPAQAFYTINVIRLPIASAGQLEEICVDSPVTLAGASSANGTILWTHNGAGSITNATTITPTYTPAAGDSETDVTLTLTVTSPTITNPLCGPAISTKILRIKGVPTATAGGSQTICENASATVNGASSTNGTILWTHNGGGSLSDATTLTPTYTASASDGGNTVTLTMTVSNAPCGPAQAFYTINVIRLPIASAGQLEEICVDSPVTLAGASSANGTILWTHNGAGSITNATTLTPTYTPAAGDSETDVTLTLTVTSPTITNPLCGPAISTKILRIKGVPTATAGGSQTICENASATVNGASSTNGTILWTHNGGGSLSDATTLTPTYTASASDGGNTVTLTMTVSNAPCGPAQAFYTINVIRLPIASAGQLEEICVDSPVTLAGASSANGTILWTHNGAGSITNATTITPTYTPAAGDSETDVTLTLTVTSPTITNPLCGPAISTKILRIKGVPTATAGGSQTICENASATVNGASSTNGTILWTHNGGGSLSDATTLTPTYTASASDGGNTVTLTMTVSNAPCGPAQAFYTINVIRLPIASAGQLEEICVDSPVTLAGASSANGTILWTHNGAGSITNATTLTPTYTPAAGDSENGCNFDFNSNKAQTITNPLCGPAISTKNFTYKKVCQTSHSRGVAKPFVRMLRPQ